MAKDDYLPLIYQILKYLYDCLKAGERPEEAMLSARHFGINPSYWRYIMMGLKDQGFIKGLTVTQAKGGYALSLPEDIYITPAGIEYLFDNSMLQKVKQVIHEEAEILPV